jgi:pimeloyl-ACP methyl ester carboxylesterase
MTYATTVYIIMIILFGFIPNPATAQKDMTREEYLQQLMKVLPEDRYTSPKDHQPGTSNPRVSPEDFTWSAWQKRTGELPPDFDELPYRRFLPGPLVLDEGGKNIPVKTIEQWNLKREEIKELAQYWITGTVPPPPGNIISEVIDDKMWGEVKEKTILLKFGPGHKAQLHVNLLIPPGEGPFPVFMCPWKKDRYDWVQAAIRRGYIGCRFTATDPKYGYPDDSEAYEEIWWPDYDFSTIMRWGWAASRALDYLYTLDYVNREQIGLTGLSRNGKMSLWAAAYDERIKAVIPISGGTGGEDPFTYTNEKYDNESIAEITRGFPYWLHPRLRFFIGRENKLPVDQNLLMALVAPRGLMITSSIFEDEGNPWGIEQAYLSARKAYEFLGAGDKIAIDLRHGLHAPSSRDMERYLDFFDYIFGRGNIVLENKLYYNYSFSRWLGLSGEKVEPGNFPVRSIDDLLKSQTGTTIKDITAWEVKKKDIRERIKWGLGNEPPSLAPGSQPDYMSSIVTRPRISEEIVSKPVGFGTLYYRRLSAGEQPTKSGLSVVLWLHEYAYPTGYGRRSQPLINNLLDKGFAVYSMDQIGFGTRIEEGRLFYERFPNWSKMGRMVADVRYAVDELSEIDFIDKQKIYTAGYALGATVGLFSAAMDERISGTVSVCGFTPMRTDTEGKTAEGIYGYSHIHGLMPRLGFFAGTENRIPFDFDEIIASVAPRSVLIIAPSWDQYSDIDDIRECFDEVQNVYELYKSKAKIELYVPDDYNRFTPEMMGEAIYWLTDQKRNK